MRYIISLITIYQFILTLYALLTWMPTAYNTPFFRWVKRLSEPYLSLFNNLSLSFNNIGFNVVIGVVLLDVLKRVLGKF